MSDEQQPKYGSRETRVNIALQKYYVSDEEWTHADLAAHLNVSEKTINEYLNHTPQSEDVQASMEAVVENTRMEIITDLRTRLRKLRDLEEQFTDAVEVQVTGYDTKQVRAAVAQDASEELDVESETHFNADVPVPSEFKEVPQFDRLRAVWAERRNTEEQLEDLLGLEEPEEFEVGGSITEQKVYKLEDSDGLPDQDVSPVAEEDSV